MFNDYQIVHESKFGLLPEVIIGILIFVLITVAISLISMAIVFKKANKPWWSALIPIYNFIVLLELATMPTWCIILLFVPFANIIVLIIASMNLAIAFNKKKYFGIGLFFLPFVFYPLLAFGKSEYQGINNSAFNTYTVDPNALVKEISIEEINQQITSTNQVEITTGKGKKSEYKVPESLQVKEEEKQPIFEPQQEMLADFRVETKPKIIENNQTENKNINVLEKKVQPSEVSSIQDFYKKFKDESTTNAPVNPAQEISQMINPEKENQRIEQDNDFVTCPKCNSKLKKGATQCFLCGAKIE